jgi:HK97 family phage major capsid protein
MNDATLAGIIGLNDSQNRPIFMPGDLNRPDSIMGYPVHGAQLANTGDEALSIVFGNLDAVKVSVVAPGLVVESSRDYLFNKAQVAYRGHIRAAAGLIDPAAVKSFKGANV